MKIRDLDFSQSPLNAEHQALGLPPVEDFVTHPDNHPVLRAAVWFAALTMLGLLLFLAWRLFFGENGGHSGFEIIESTLRSPTFWSAVAVGFFAQVIDGALGMAYGITATTFLLSAGASPAAASASVHIAEVFTTGLSGISHAKLGNVNKSLFLRLLLPGMVGAILGAVLITSFDGEVMKPFISAYLLLMGLYILRKAYRHVQQQRREPKHVAKLAMFGGFVDAAGGGGWGPVVTSSLLGSAHHYRLGELRRVLPDHHQRHLVHPAGRPARHLANGRGAGVRRHVRRALCRAAVQEAVGTHPADHRRLPDHPYQRLQHLSGSGLIDSGIRPCQNILGKGPIPCGLSSLAATLLGRRCATSKIAPGDLLLQRIDRALLLSPCCEPLNN
jgi:hypothetical protein